MLQAIEELRERVEENTALLHHILRRMSSNKNDRDTEKSHGFDLPIADMDYFNKINKELQDDSKASQLVSYINKSNIALLIPIAIKIQAIFC